jgi:hypothetical protein
MSPDGIACPLADAPVEPAGAEASHGRHGVGQTTRRHDLQEGREGTLVPLQTQRA